MELRRYLPTFRRWIPIIVVGGLVVGMVAFLFIGAQPRVYEASATLRLGQTVSGGPILLTPVSDRLLTEYAYRAVASSTLAAVADDLGLPVTPTRLQRDIDVTVAPESTLLTITARANTPELAASLAQTVGDRLIATSDEAQGEATIEQALRDDLDAIRSQIVEVRDRITELSAVTNLTPAQLATLEGLESRLVDLIAAYGDVLDRMLATGAYALAYVDRAVEPEAPIEPRPLLFSLLAVAGAVLLLAGLAVLFSYFDQTLREPEDLADTTGLPVLASLTELTQDALGGPDRQLVTVRQPRSEIAEAYRRLRANLDVAVRRGQFRSLLITGSVPTTGKSVAAANLAVAFAESGRRVVLVDADFRHPSIHPFFGLPVERGLATLFTHAEVPVDYVVARTQVHNLDVLASGVLPANPAESLASPRMRQVIDELMTRHDLVIVVGPALPDVSDSVVLGSFLDRTLVVVTQGTRRDVVRRTIDVLSIAQAQIIGTALFRRRRGSHPPDRATQQPIDTARTTSGSQPAREAARSG